MSGNIWCASCDTDLEDFPNHMCGFDPVVQPNEKHLIAISNEQITSVGLIKLPDFYACSSCYSVVGRQHYNCKLLSTKAGWLRNRIWFALTGTFFDRPTMSSDLPGQRL